MKIAISNILIHYCKLFILTKNNKFYYLELSLIKIKKNDKIL